MADELRSVVGQGVRRLRTAAGLTPDDVAREARRHGLVWTYSKVYALERGDKAVSAPELLVLAQVMTDACGRPVRLAELIEGDGDVALTPELIVTREWVRRMLSGGQPEPIEPYDEATPGELPRAVAKAWRRREKLYGGKFSSRDLVRIESAGGLAEERAARTLHITAGELAALSARLWRRTLTEERDNRAGADAGAQKRGRITRELLDELRARLAEVDGHG